ncbi:MAG: EVE domain-containing protein, partial [Acidobacteria bacterium]
DRAFIYHTGDEKAVVGIAQVASDAYTDSRPGHEPLPVVDLAFEKQLENPVSLKRIKADPAFSGFALVKLPRLSVMPVTEGEWDRIIKLTEATE